jgi:hypothetical protein
MTPAARKGAGVSGYWRRCHAPFWPDCNATISWLLLTSELASAEIVADNLASHKVAGVRAAMERVVLASDSCLPIRRT